MTHARSFSRLSRPVAALALAALATACGSPPKPATFVTSATLDGGVDSVSRVLATQGYAPAGVDRKAGIVHTEWKDTGFLFGQVQNTPATIVRRFTVVLTPMAEGSSVTVRMDVKRCAQGGFSIVGADVRGPCEEVGLVPSSMQSELDTLGAKVREALATPAPTAPPPGATPAPSASGQAL